MIVKRPWLIALGSTALALIVLAPTQMADSRLPRWMNVAADLKQVVDGFRHALHSGHAQPQKPARVAAAPQARLPGPGPFLERPQAVQDAAALKQAYAVAVANERLKGLGYDPTGILEAIRAYRSENLEGGDLLAQKISDPTVRTALEWVALRVVPQKVSLDRLNAFARAHPDWPAQTWFRHQVEAHLLRVQDPKVVDEFFAKSAPVTPLGKFVQAKALKTEGRPDEAAKIARAIYRENDLNPFLESRLKAEFGNDLTKGDYKYRADRLVYKDQVGPAMRAALQAGPDVVALERARIAMEADAGADKAMVGVPAQYRNDPGLLLAEIQKDRHADKLKEALALMLSAPHDPALLIDGDEWWTERRLLARKLLDANNPVAAYVVCAGHSAVSAEAKVDAEFHAGWIALRFMNEPTRAAWHFAQAAKLAETPTSVARIAYWQGRTAANSIAPDAMSKSEAFYRKAAEHGSTYYGQLAREALGLTSDPVQEPATTATGMNRTEAVRVTELLYAAGDTEAAYALAVAGANNLKDDDQVAALAKVILDQQDAHLALTIGKMTGQRGIPVDPLAFPTFGIPPYDALQNSASPPVVYSVARQESAFLPTVVSKAGAKGLMQMIDSTAKRTATKAGLPYDGARMLSDAAFNAKLGAAHLGALLAEQGGSYILTFAAYNAGGGRVKQWIETYGDPRQPGVDAVDWVERIPFTETRNYVQRVLANVNMYKAIFAEQAKIAERREREAKL